MHRKHRKQPAGAATRIDASRRLEVFATRVTTLFCYMAYRYAYLSAEGTASCIDYGTAIPVDKWVRTSPLRR